MRLEILESLFPFFCFFLEILQTDIAQLLIAIILSQLFILLELDLLVQADVLEHLLDLRVTIGEDDLRIAV